MSMPSVTMSRREFGRSLARAALLGGLGVLGLILVRRRAAAGACARDGVCGRCPELDACGLPPAVASRRPPRERI